jgi:hypothetical protein
MREVRTNVIDLHREIGGLGGDVDTVTSLARSKSEAREQAPA